MLVIHGRYHFGTKRVACRNDFCTHCKRPTFVEQFRFFVVAHILFVPLIPLGFRRRWVCTSCRNDPAGKRPTAKPVLYLGLIAGAFGMGIAFLVPMSTDDIEGKWGLRGIFTAFTAFIIFKLFRDDRESYRQARQEVVPLSKERCPYCGETLFHLPTSHCPKCRVEIK